MSYSPLPASAEEDATPGVVHLASPYEEHVSRQDLWIYPLCAVVCIVVGGYMAGAAAGNVGLVLGGVASLAVGALVAVFALLACVRCSSFESGIKIDTRERVAHVRRLSFCYPLTGVHCTTFALRNLAAEPWISTVFFSQPRTAGRAAA
jgi:hypothetical protein